MRFRLFLLLAALAAFGGALWAPFVFDDLSLSSNPAFESSIGWTGAFRLTETRPVVFLSYWLNFRLSRDPFSFHLTSLFLHLLCVWTASLAFERLLPDRAARLAAAILAIHPLLTEPVVYVFARSSLLATLFCLLTLLFWLKDRRWPAVAFFVLAVLSKEEALAFPLFVLLLARGFSPQLIALFSISVAAGLRSLYATASIAGSGAGAEAGISSFDYFSYQGVAILRYLWLLLVPVGMTVDPEIRVAPLLASLAWGVIAVLAILAWRTVRNLQPGFWLLGGLILLIPTSTVFPAADLAADRRMYLPMIAFAALLGLLLQRAPIKLLALWLITLLVLSFAQTRLWQDPQALWMDAARRAPEKIRPKRQIARLVSPEQAVALLEEARRVAPDDPAVAADLGFAHLRAGNPALALSEFGRALALAPDSADAINNRGVALLALGQTDAAREDFSRALDKNPCHFDALWNLRKTGDSRTVPPSCRFSAEQQARLTSAP